MVAWGSAARGCRRPFGYEADRSQRLGSRVAGGRARCAQCRLEAGQGEEGVVDVGVDAVFEQPVDRLPGRVADVVGLPAQDVHDEAVGVDACGRTADPVHGVGCAQSDRQARGGVRVEIRAHREPALLVVRQEAAAAAEPGRHVVAQRASARYGSAVLLAPGVFQPVVEAQEGAALGAELEDPVDPLVDLRVPHRRTGDAALGEDLDHAAGGLGAVQRGRGRSFYDLDPVDVGGIEVVERAGRVAGAGEAVADVRGVLGIPLAADPDAVDVDQRLVAERHADVAAQPYLGSRARPAAALLDGHPGQAPGQELVDNTAGAQA